jgi:hypothetical protein
MNQQNPHQGMFRQWHFARYSEAQIREELEIQGHHVHDIHDVVTAYKKHCQAIRSQKGLVFIVIGAILGFASCVLTILDVMPELRDFILVGLTTIAVCIAVCGCYYIFE